MSGFGRAMRYFTYRSQVYVLFIMLGSVALTLYKCLLQEQTDSFHNWFTILSTAWLPLTVFAYFSIGTSFGYFFSQLVAFGCRRMHVILGNLVMNTIVMLECAALSWLLVLGLGGKESMVHKPMIIGALFLIEGLAQLLGAAMARWGKTVYMFFTLAVIILVLFASFFIQKMHIRGIGEKILLLLGSGWIVLLLGAASCLLAHVLAYRMIRMYEIKA